MDNHKDATKATIGYIFFPDPLNENNIAVGKNKISLPTIGECKIEVFPNEGDIPHFHIRNEEAKFDTCVKIYSAEQFIHGKHNGILNNKQCKALNKWLDMKPRGKFTNWETIENIYFVFNPDCKFPENKCNGKPDYSHMKIIQEPKG